jgi:chloride channel protein, CIC family
VKETAEPSEQPGNLLVLALLALIVGAAAGLLGAMFRLALQKADSLRDVAIAAAHVQRGIGFVVVVVACGSATGFAAWLVRRFSSHASGSGIPHVEAVLHGELLPQAPFRLIPVKFLGGLLAIGSGLALGREGPSVQMGASIGHLVGEIGRRKWPDCRVLFAAGAGAGLATAFNAPMAGAVFVLEELVRRFEPRIAIAALAASSTAITVCRQFLGDAPDFHIDTLVYPGFGAKPLYFGLGLFAGFLGIVYNRTLLGTLAVADRLARLPVELRAALIGVAVGALAWFVPDLVGGGDAISQRTLLGMESFRRRMRGRRARGAERTRPEGSKAPGGLFAPLLVLGAQLGLSFGLLCRLAFPDLDLQPQGFAVVGMAALFTGIVRAPLTGIVLVTEMTASVTLLLPMLGACFVAMLVPTLLRDPPIYDSLRERTLGLDKARDTARPPDPL